MQRNRDALLVAAGAATGAALASPAAAIARSEAQRKIIQSALRPARLSVTILLRILRLLTADETRLKDQIAVKRDLPPAVVDEMLSSEAFSGGRPRKSKKRESRGLRRRRRRKPLHRYVNEGWCKAIRIVDFDQVSASSLNRHAVATLRMWASRKYNA